MQRELLMALSTGWVERALGVSRATVATWRQGKFPERRQRQLEEAVSALLPDNTKEAAPPKWAGRLIRTVDVIAEKVGVTSEERAAIDAAYAAQSSPPAAETPPHPEEDDPAGAERRDRRR